MPLQSLNVPFSRNAILSAFTLSYLLPVFEQDELFDKAFECLFGKVSRRVSAALIKELESYTPDVPLTSLNQLINTHLRPKVADYIIENHKNFVDLYPSKEIFKSRVESLRNPDSCCDLLVIKALFP